MKIGIISDTHNLLRPEVCEILQDCEMILHAGDVCNRDVLNRLEAIAPVKAVCGNNDWLLSDTLQDRLDFELDGLRIYMVHQKYYLPKDLSPYDLVIYGHSHQYAAEWLDFPGNRRTLLLNPGSCGPGRFMSDVTMAVLRTGPDGFTADRIDFSRPPKKAAPKENAGDLRRQIETVIRETRKGRTLSETAAKAGIDEALAEQIARLYVTHPGVTVEGIMAKMGL